MKADPFTRRRKFASQWDEIGYLYHKLLYWLYERGDRRGARRYAKRLEVLLPKADPHHRAIFGEENWSLVYEAKGDLNRAIKHREKEIKLMQRLHEISRDAPYEKDVLEDKGYDALSDRLDLLAMLYHENGNLDRAIEALERSKQVCAEHRIKFDAADLLKEYLAERGCRSDRNGVKEPAVSARGANRDHPPSA